MGKRIRVQRRGRGGSAFTASTHKRVAAAQYPPLSKTEIEGSIQGRVEEIIHEPGRGSPLALVQLENGQGFCTVVPEGIFQGQTVQIGTKAPVEVGNILTLGEVPPGTMVCNVELQPGDGGKVCRSSGSYSTVVAHTQLGTMIKFPSGKTTYLNNLNRAMVGVVSGAGRLDKPFLKAGPRYHLMHAKGHRYQRPRGVAMIAAVHPYGSSHRGARKVTTVSRHAPPGQKVGLIAARSAGGKRKRRE
jgi:large subunit ribosomal protein L2